MIYPEETLGIGSFVGEVRMGPDGDLYQWHEGVDGLGYPLGGWLRRLRSAGRAVQRVARLPGVRQALPVAAGMIPGIGPAAAAGVRAAQSAGILGIGNYVGEIRQGPDGELYQWEEGVDGLGYPVGGWMQRLRAAGRALHQAARSPAGQAVLSRVAPRAHAFAREAGILGW